MKTKQVKELPMKDVDELIKMLKDAREKLFTLSMDQAQFKLKNTQEVSHVKKEIAQILTAIRGKELTING